MTYKNEVNGYQGEGGRAIIGTKHTKEVLECPAKLYFLTGWYTPCNNSLSSLFFLYTLLYICILFYNKKD